MPSRLPLAVALITVVATCLPAHAGGDQYRRWTSPKDFTCVAGSSGEVLVTVAEQNVEFGNLPDSAEYTIFYVRNGRSQRDGPYKVEQNSGTRNYAGFSTFLPSYPLGFAFGFDTLIDSTVVYRSTLQIDCDGNDSGQVIAHNADFGAPEQRWRRWTMPKSFRCDTVPDGVEVQLEDQNVEFNDLPANAEFNIVYDVNGDVNRQGPFPVEQTTGQRNYAAFTQHVDAYPVRFNFSLETVVDDEVIYRSTLQLHCDADYSAVAIPVNMAPFELLTNGFESDARLRSMRD